MVKPYFCTIKTTIRPIYKPDTYKVVITEKIPGSINLRFVMSYTWSPLSNLPKDNNFQHPVHLEDPQMGTISGELLSVLFTHNNN